MSGNDSRRRWERGIPFRAPALCRPCLVLSLTINIGPIMSDPYFSPKSENMMMTMMTTTMMMMTLGMMTMRMVA